MDHLTLLQFFSPEKKYSSERLISCLQFCSEIAQLKFDNEDQLYSVLEKGLLYTGMLNSEENLSLTDKIDVILNQFREYSERITVAKLPIAISRHPHQIIKAIQDFVTHIVVMSARCSCPLFLIFEFGEEYYVLSIEDAKVQSSLCVGTDIIWRSEPSSAAITAAICRHSTEYQRKSRVGNGFVNCKAVVLVRDGGEQELNKISKPLKELYKTGLVETINAWRKHKEVMQQSLATMQSQYGPTIPEDVVALPPLPQATEEPTSAARYDRPDTNLSTSVAYGSLTSSTITPLRGDAATLDVTRRSLSSTAASEDIGMLGLRAYAALRDQVIQGGLWMSQSSDAGPCLEASVNVSGRLSVAAVGSDSLPAAGDSIAVSNSEESHGRLPMVTAESREESALSAPISAVHFESHANPENYQGQKYSDFDFNASLISSPRKAVGSREETDFPPFLGNAQGPMSPYLSRTNEQLAEALRTIPMEEMKAQRHSYRSSEGKVQDECQWPLPDSQNVIPQSPMSSVVDVTSGRSRLEAIYDNAAAQTRVSCVGSGTSAKDIIELVRTLCALQVQIEENSRSKEARRKLRRIEYGRKLLASESRTADSSTSASTKATASAIDSSTFKSPSIKALHQVMASIEGRQQKVTFAEDKLSLQDQLISGSRGYKSQLRSAGHDYNPLSSVTTTPSTVAGGEVHGSRPPGRTEKNRSDNPSVTANCANNASKIIDCDESSDEVRDEQRLDGMLYAYETALLPRFVAPSTPSNWTEPGQRVSAPYLNNYIHGIDNGIDQGQLSCLEDAESDRRFQPTSSASTQHQRSNSAPNIQPASAALEQSGLVPQPSTQSQKLKQQRAKSVPRPDPAKEPTELKTRRKWNTDDDVPYPDESTVASGSTTNTSSVNNTSVVRAAKMEIVLGNSEDEKERRAKKFEQIRGRKLLEAELRKKSRDASVLSSQQPLSQPDQPSVAEERAGYTQQYLKKAVSTSNIPKQQQRRLCNNDDLPSVPSSIGMSSCGGDSASGGVGDSKKRLKINVEDSVYSAGSQRTAASNPTLLDITSGLNLGVIPPKPVLSSQAAGGLAAAVVRVPTSARGGDKQRPESVSRVRAKQTNHQQIRNAISTVCLAGSHFEPLRTEVLCILEKCSNVSEENFGIGPNAPITQFLVMLAHADSFSYKGLYGIESTLSSGGREPDTLKRLHGKGPKVVPFNAIVDYFKYESSAHRFSRLPTRSITTTTDGFCIDLNKFKK